MICNTVRFLFLTQYISFVLDKKYNLPKIIVAIAGIVVVAVVVIFVALKKKKSNHGDDSGCC